jgi:hypothetical protein
MGVFVGAAVQECRVLPDLETLVFAIFHGVGKDLGACRVAQARVKLERQVSIGVEIDDSVIGQGAASFDFPRTLP